MKFWFLRLLIFLIFYLNPNRGYFLIYIYILSKWGVKYKLKINEDIKDKWGHLIDINGNKGALVNSGIGKIEWTSRGEHASKYACVQRCIP